MVLNNIEQASKSNLFGIPWKCEDLGWVSITVRVQEAWGLEHPGALMDFTFGLKVGPKLEIDLSQTKRNIFIFSLVGHVEQDVVS